jgi:hypothetical protein
MTLWTSCRDATCLARSTYQICCRVMSYQIKLAPHAAPLARRQRRAPPLSGPPGARRSTRP